VYVRFVRGPEQKEVWLFAKTVAQTLAAARPDLMTAEYRREKRPRGRVLVDYNQNRWGSTLASILFAASAAGRDRLDAGDVAGSRKGIRIETSR